MFHACATRFDVTENLENFLDFEVIGSCEKDSSPWKRVNVVQVSTVRLRNFMNIVIPDFKDKTRYTLYMSFRSQFSYIATNKG